MRQTSRRAAALLIAAIGIFASIPPARADAGMTVVCLGDSLTEGYGVAPEESYPSVVERRLNADGYDVRIVNAGISGSTSASALSRLRWQLRAKPDLLVLALGANDGLRGVAPDATRQNLAETIQLALEHQVRVVLAGMTLPPNYGPDHVAAFEQIFPALAKRYDLPLIPFLLEGVAARPELNLADGIHPNAEGHLWVAENVLSVLRPLLKKP